ncbi:unnamed protein product [Clonostachys rosea f. rosea IK726]|uniref:Uncharacterized protein n=1 Tax=Clonostachys rosea f. rosea IK726 TaxID=1349383 RepID=A0ACA9U2Q3_BIOOC|nr:unnamed protein product [Clonostachys rosea f. rosea IK726]
MDITTWSPHGLITTPLSEILYLSAQISMDPFGNIIDPKEQQTVELFCALFNKFIFREDEFISFSQAQPQLQSNEACGFVIENYVADKDAYHILCFLEVRRAKNQTGSHIVALETQALGNCGQFFQANPGVPFIYACTLVGTYIRCWTILATEDGGPRMQGFWGGIKDNWNARFNT